MSRPIESSRPRLVPGCRMSDQPGQASTLLIPEGALQLNGPGARIIDLCDGVHTYGEILGMLQQEFTTADPTRVERETGDLLERLHARRVIDL
jgi:pyrroloquinoline quinone biosynthesis protein D